jgi:hypothetical protein
MNHHSEYMVLTGVAILLFQTAAVAGEAPAVEQEDYKVGVTKAAITEVDKKDPRDELETKTRYLDKNEMALLRQADHEAIKCPMYFVIKFLRPAHYRISVVCHADGNHQIFAHSPRSKTFSLQDFRGVQETKTIPLNFNAADSAYLILNCTQGNLYVDAVMVDRTDGQQQGDDASDRK